MPFQPFTFDATVTQTEPGMARVPEGYYLVEAEAMEPTAENYEKTQGTFTTVRILSGPDAAPGTGVGGRLRQYNQLTPEKQFGFARLLGGFGMADIAKSLDGKGMPDYPTYQRLIAAVSGRLKGRKAVAFVADRPGLTRPVSGIEGWYPESDWVNYKQTAPLGTGGAGPMPQRNGPGGPQPGTSTVLEGAADLFADLEASV